MSSFSSFTDIDHISKHLLYTPDILCFPRLPQVKQGLGGNVRLILSGAAPLATHVEAYLRVVTCAHVLQGYGIQSVEISLHIPLILLKTVSLIIIEILLPPLRTLCLKYFFLFLALSASFLPW